MERAIIYIQRINDEIINPIIFLLIGVGVLVFLWGMTKYILNADDASARKEGTQHMIWGIVGITIMVSFIGIINVLLNTFGIPAPAGF